MTKAQPLGPDQSFGEQRMDDGEEKVRIRARPDEMVTVGQLDGLGAAGIDDDELPTAAA